jgi:uncharacterized protein YodC (DUF2158 family)
METEMKVGDKVTIKAGNKYDDGNYDDYPVTKPGSTAYITELLEHGAQLATTPDCCPREHSGDSLFFGFDEFELVNNTTFKVGDRVRLTMKGIREWRTDGLDDDESSNPIFHNGTVHEIVEEGNLFYDMGFRYRVTWDNDAENGYFEGDIENAA